MRTNEAPIIHLGDYQAPGWLIDHVALDFRLEPEKTRVISRLDMRPNAQAQTPGGPIVLDGIGLELISISITGRELGEGEYILTGEKLIIENPPQENLTVEIENTCQPEANTALSGLYRSGGNYCTQCEAEGFRRITYFIDRPDILSRYRVRIEAERASNPVLLSNGNKVLEGEIEGTDRHFAIWEDPFPKPCYLFALVAGKLACVKDSFTSRSGRNIALEIHVEPGKEERCGWAMNCLKRAMKWDEEAFGREYDLDIFMIVAVPDFNMGAMENKGLNVFNDKYILALPQTATDYDYANIEAIIAHEYFHNWSGNRVTCRDWFQLCLKEGLTVFRDQEFSSDQRSRPVKRIDDVKRLRSQQFPEDAGPLAHPVRPSSYMEINNFYTATVYEKGAEVIRMLQTLIGKEAFRKGMDLYFARHDGKAATVEDFIAAMHDASGRDLEQFFRWYEQAGTPHVSAEGDYDADARTYTLKLTQSTPATPEQEHKEAFHIPLRIGLVDSAGNDMALKDRDAAPVMDGLIELRKAADTFCFGDVHEEPVLSLNRNFSAPVRLSAHQSFAGKLRLAASDSDLFNRWEAAQKLGSAVIMGAMDEISGKTPDTRRCEQLGEALAGILVDEALEPAYVARMLTLPSEGDIAGTIASNVDPQLIHDAREKVRARLGRQLHAQLLKTWQAGAPGDDETSSQSAGKRDLRHAALMLLSASDATAGAAMAKELFENASGMTSEISALEVLSRLDVPEREEVLEAFYNRHSSDHLLVDKWFSLHAQVPFPETLGRIRSLMQHEAFSLNRPNTVRALIGAFAMANPVCFHAPDGSGYELVGSVVLELDKINPQVAARMASAFRSWKMLEPDRSSLARATLERINQTAGLSRDTFEITGRSLAESAGE